MKKIGIFTLFRDNYGSALQCYATMNSLKKLGYEPFLLFDSPAHGLISIVKRGTKLAYRSIRFHNYWDDRKIMNAAMAKERRILTDQSKAAIDNFTNEKLHPIMKDMHQLTEMSRSSEWQYFITGSDQVWNASRVIADSYLLKFAPPQKRVAFSASFGTKDVANFNIPVLKRELPKYRAISVREESGRKIVRNLTGREVERLADPVVLLTKDEWIDVAKEGMKIGEPYICVHFLNEPNQVAVQDFSWDIAVDKYEDALEMTQ